MPMLLAVLAWVSRVLVISTIARVLTFFGFASISYVGATSLIDYIEAQLLTVYGQLPSTVVGFLQLLQFDYAIAVLFAALTFRVSYGLATRFGPRLADGTAGVSNA